MTGNILASTKGNTSVITNPVFADVIMAEVGATMVGSMVQTYSEILLIKEMRKGISNSGIYGVVCCLKKIKLVSMKIY
jgi:phosphatidylserine decarboxylase